MDTTLPTGEFDAIVIGSGPGGATVARELSKRKKRVLILERGGDAPLREGFWGTGSILSAVSVGEKLAVPRAITTGGTTAVYFAVADLPPLDIFRSLGIDLSRELEEVRKELPLTVLPDELFGAQAMRVCESATALGYSWKKSTMLVDLSKCRAGYTYEAKWTARSYVREAVAEGATLLTGARVHKILVDGDRAIGVEYKLKKKRTALEVRQAFGAKVVLAAGGAVSPIILRASGIKNVASRGFYCDPGFAVFGSVSGLSGGDNFIGSMGAGVSDGIGVGDANLARAFYRMFMFGNRRFIRMFFHSRSIGVGVMVKDGLGGMLQEDGRYHKELAKEDLRKLGKGEEMARRIVRHAGGKRLFKSPLVASHVGGAVRIGEHVDENLQTEYRNLHVCDGSVIPESVEAAPTLTLVCLGKYLANRVAPAL